MENIADGRIIQDNHFTEIRLNSTQILDVAAISERAMLSVVPSGKVLFLLLQPVDHGICIFLDGCSESDYFVPFANFAEELITMRTLVNVVEDRMVWANYLWRRRGLTWDCLDDWAIDWCIELDFDHVAG